MQSKDEPNQSEKRLEKVAALTAKKDWKSIIAELEKLKPEDRSVNLTISLANAYVDEGYETGDRSLYTKAIDILLPLTRNLEKAWQYYRIMGLAFFHLDYYGYALDFLEKAYNLLPRSLEATKNGLLKVIEDCHRYLSLPYFEKNFKQRVKEVWEEFEKNEEDFRRELDKGLSLDEKEALHIKCAEILQIASKNFFCFMEKEDDIYKLILTPFAKLMPLYEILNLKQAAPKSVLDKWEIQVGIPKDFFYKIPDFPDLSHELKFELKTHKDEVFRLLPISGKIPFPLLYTTAFVLPLIDDLFINEIGEAAFTKFIGLPEDPKPYKPDDEYYWGIFSLAELPDFLKRFRIEVDQTPQYLLDRFVRFTQKTKNKTYRFRSDIVSGKTRCIKFIRDCNIGEETAVNELEADGVIAGYFCYGKSHFEGNDSRRKSLQFNEDFRHQLLLKAGEENVKIIGYASGKYFDYVDVLIFDLLPVMEAARDIFNKSDVQFGGFHVFRKKEGTVLLKGDIFWKKEKSTKDPSSRVYGLEKDSDGRYIFYPIEEN